MLPSISTAAPSTRNGRRSALRSRPTSAPARSSLAGPDREHDELVAADACDGVRFADDRLEAPRERLQNGVAGAVAADVVDVLEAVEVDRR